MINHVVIGDSFSVAVIGGGPIGLAVAYELTRLGHRPVLIEADGCADHTRNSHEPLSVILLDFYDSFKSLIAASLRKQNSRKSQQAGNCNCDQ